MQEGLEQGCGSTIEQILSIPLPEVVYDKRARDGTWCTLPYPGHPKGCKNFPQCPEKYPRFLDIKDTYNWFAVTEEFDLKKHAKKWKERHPNATEKQCRNLLYWQNGVRKRLYNKVLKCINPFNGDIILRIPEACGVDVFKTMEKIGIKLQRNPDYVIKVMLIGKRRTGKNEN